MRANTLWLWSQAAALVVVVAASITGYVVATQTSLLEEELVTSINATFYGPGMAVSLLVNQLVLLARKPRVVRPAERVVLAIEFALIVLLIVSSPIWELTILSAAISVCLPPVALTALVIIIVGNVVAADARRRIAPPVAPVSAPEVSGP